MSRGLEPLVEPRVLIRSEHLANPEQHHRSSDVAAGARLFDPANQLPRSRIVERRVSDGFVELGLKRIQVLAQGAPLGQRGFDDTLDRFRLIVGEVDLRLDGRR